MNPATLAVLTECTQGSDDERLTFPEVVGKLMQAGVERYDTDLQRSEKTYYMPDGSSAVLKAHDISAPIAEAFSAEGVETAVSAIQAGQIKYRQFCNRIAEAGCVGYLVSLVGRRAVYYGRTGDAHVEYFPPA